MSALWDIAVVLGWLSLGGRIIDAVRFRYEGWERWFYTLAVVLAVAQVIERVLSDGTLI